MLAVSPPMGTPWLRGLAPTERRPVHTKLPGPAMPAATAGIRLLCDSVATSISSANRLTRRIVSNAVFFTSVPPTKSKHFKRRRSFRDYASGRRLQP